MSENKQSGISPHAHTSAFRLGVAYLGCCIGAGYLSGQELFQFFSSHGTWGFAGLAVAVLCIFLAGWVILSLSVATGETRMDRIVVWFDCKPLRAAVAVFEVVFLFMIYTLCVAAFGSLLAQIAGLSPLVGGLVFCVLSTTLSLFGVRGLLHFFSYVIPALVLTTVLIALLALCTANGIDFPPTEVGGLISGFWLFDSVTYAVFSLFCALPVLVPLGSSVSSLKTARRGALIGALLIGTLAFVIILAIGTNPSVASTALPMLELAFTKSRLAGFVYAVLLVFGIFSAGLSSQSAINEYLMQRFTAKKRFLIPVSVVTATVALLLGLFGFRDLIGILYPVFGYIGFLPLALLFLHALVFYCKRRKEKKK